MPIFDDFEDVTGEDVDPKLDPEAKPDEFPGTRIEWKFICEYVRCGKASQAAKNTWTDGKDSHATLRVRASRLMAQERIRNAIHQYKGRLKRSFPDSPQEYEKELSYLAMSNVKDLIQTNEWGSITLADIQSLPDSVAAAISQIETRPGKYGTAIKIKFHAKESALKELIKLHLEARKLTGQGNQTEQVIKPQPKKLLSNANPSPGKK